MLAMPSKNISTTFERHRANKPCKSIGDEFGSGKVASTSSLCIDTELPLRRYVAYGTTGNIDEDLKKLFAEQHEKSPREEFLQLIEKKRPLAMKMHGTRRVGPSHCLLNELFRTNQCEALCDQLANSSWIVKGEPGRSPFLTHAVSFHGPMYQVRPQLFFLLFSPRDSCRSSPVMS